MLFTFFATSICANPHEFHKQYTHQELTFGINRIYRILGKYQKEHMQEFHILVMILYDLNVNNVRVKEWLDEAPVQKLLKYDLPLTYMNAADPMIEEFSRMSDEYSKVHLKLLDPAASDQDIEREWWCYCARFRVKKHTIHKMRTNIMKAFKVNNPLDRWILQKIYSMTYFEKSFWLKYKKTNRISHLANAMCALYDDKISEATAHFELYKKDEYERLPTNDN